MTSYYSKPYYILRNGRFLLVERNSRYSIVDENDDEVAAFSSYTEAVACFDVKCDELRKEKAS